MEMHYTLTDSEFEEKFSSCKLIPSYFTHEAHLRLAWIHIQKHGVETADTLVNNQIKAFANSLNAPGKYHRTITSAAIYAVAHFVESSTSSTFKAFIEEFPELKTNFLG